MSIRQSQVASLPEGTHTIEPGLYLRVRGKYRNFVVRLQVGGKRREIGLGSATELTIAAAKAKAAALKAEAASGNEEWGKKPEERKSPAFKDYAVRTLDVMASAKRWRGKHTEAHYRSLIKNYAIPTFGDKAVDAVTREDVLSALNLIWNERPQAGLRLRMILDHIFDYAAADGWTDKRSPAAWKGNLDRFLPAPQKVRATKHHEAMTMEEARKAVRLFIGSEVVSHRAVIFILLTASRVGEAVNARWDEVDFDAKVWAVPAERRKDGKPFPHRVPLSDQAIFLLKKMPRRSDYIFQSLLTSRPISPSVTTLAIQRYIGRKVTIHGCRSTFSDWCAETGVDVILAEKSLMHATGNAVRQAYQRSDLLEQRRPVMQAWADALFEGVDLEE